MAAMSGLGLTKDGLRHVNVGQFFLRLLTGLLPVLLSLELFLTYLVFNRGSSHVDVGQV